MKILVFMSDNRRLDSNKETAQYNSLAAYINKVYCDKYGYSFVYVRPYYKDPNVSTLFVCKDKNNNPRHASWAKLLSAQHCMTLSYDYIVYIDSDCIFKDFSVSLESIINDHRYNSSHVVYASNLPWQRLPCAGFFIVKVTDESTAFLKKWYDYILPTYDSIKWTNTIALAGNIYNWQPGTHWEQDALWCIIANESLPYKYLDENSFEENNQQFLRHICHLHSIQRTPYFSAIINKLENMHGLYIDIIDSIHMINLDTSVWDSSG